MSASASTNRSTMRWRLCRANSSWLDRAYSNVSRTTAERFATAVADRAYNSAEFKAALEDVASGIAKEIGVRLDAATGRVSKSVLSCVQTALQSKYGQAVAQVFAEQSQRNLDLSAEQGQAKIEAGDLVLTNAASISGIVLIEPAGSSAGWSRAWDGALLAWWQAASFLPLPG